MILKTGVTALLCGLLARGAAAGELPSIFGEQQEEMQIWPMIGREPAVGTYQQAPGSKDSPQAQGAPAREKSPKRAMLLSAILPGAGEFYAGSRKKAAVFFGIEALAVGLTWSWHGKGKDIEDEFREMADDSWDVEKYLAWRSTARAIRNNSFTHALPCSLEVMEGSFGDCGGRDKQQYYELLGKYDQFVAGWDDLVFKDTGNPVDSFTQIDSVEKVQSAHRLEYENKRDDSNKYLKRASSLGGLILVNHVLSAIDAARTARARAQGADPAALERRTRLLFTLHPGSRGQVPMLMAYKPFD